MTRPVIVWGDPPPRGGGRAPKYLKFVQPLLDRPGEWACVQRNPDAKPLERVRTAIDKGPYKRLAAPGRFQARVRRTPGGDYGLWLRYTPGDET